MKKQTSYSLGQEFTYFGYKSQVDNKTTDNKNQTKFLEIILDSTL